VSGQLRDADEDAATDRAIRAQRDILRVATEEFAANGYAGARVDEIAARTRTTKRMIYYYFASKESLYLAVLEQVYAQIRRVERGIQIDELSPDEALRTIAEATYDHHTTHQAFIQLVSIENIHRAEHLRRSATILRENVTAITLLEDVIKRGVADGIFRDDIDAVDVHMVISAYACFHVANRHTFAAIFDRDMLDPTLQDSHRRLIGDMVVATMTDRSAADTGSRGASDGNRAG
jgi:AcrR family transcriptional regulator